MNTPTSKGVSQLLVSDVTQKLLQLAPTRYAMEGDVIGLQIGSLTQPARKIWLSLDASPAIMEAAVDDEVDLLISHHALLYRPLKRVDVSTRRGAAIARALAHPLTVFNAHTNLDIAPGGVNDVLADLFGLIDCTVLDVHGYEPPSGDGKEAHGVPFGLGRVGSAKLSSTGKWPTLAEFAEIVKQRLGMSGVRFVGDDELPIRRVAIVGGSGSDLVSHSIAAGADVLVTADCSHHDVAEAWENGLAIIDATHAAMELPVLPVVAKKLKTMLSEAGHDVIVEVAPLQEDPFAWR